MEMKWKMIAMIFLLINYFYYYCIACGSCCCPRGDRQCHHVAQLHTFRLPLWLPPYWHPLRHPVSAVTLGLLTLSDLLRRAF